MNARGHIVTPVRILVATVQVGNARPIITLHVVNDAEMMTVASRVPFRAAHRAVNGRAVIRARSG